MNDLRRYTADEVLRDGVAIHIRAIRPDDKERLRKHAEGLGPQSVYFRFLGPKKGLSEKDLRAFTELDFVTRVALVATLGKGDAERIIGVGRYALTESAPDAPRSAELAFTVVDEYQHHGIGTLLLEHLLSIAHGQGIRQFEAEVLGDNKAMLGVFSGSGVIAKKRVRSGVAHVVFSTDETEGFRKAKEARHGTIPDVRSTAAYERGNPRTMADKLDKDDCILFSGAAQGAEGAFGAAAERHGIEEVNFTFDGHSDARARGIRVLTHAELKSGDVSLAYVSRLMHREFRDTPLFRKVLQTIWHQVNNGQEIYVVGQILDDGTVKGGTGWGAEFAKLCNKTLFVFDQEKRAWFGWDGSAWRKADAPVIGHPHFTGTGTRFLNDAGRKAIDELFARSFAK